MYNHVNYWFLRSPDRRASLGARALARKCVKIVLAGRGLCLAERKAVGASADQWLIQFTGDQSGGGQRPTPNS
jgi:hypothetical protein